MHSYSGTIENITKSDLSVLGPQLSLPSNWSYEVIKLAGDYNVTTPSLVGGKENYIFILLDDFANAYSCLDCNATTLAKQYNMVLPNSTISKPKSAAKLVPLLSAFAAVVLALLLL